MTYGHAPDQEPLSRESSNLHFGKLFLVHHHYTLSLYESCPGGEKKICVINANMDRVGIYHPSIPSISLLFKLAVELKLSSLKKSWDI